MICGIKLHVQIGDYSGVRDSGPRKRDEDYDVDEDGHRGDDSPDGTPAPPRERGRESPGPLCFLLHGLPLDGERFPLWSLSSMEMMAPSEILLHGLR